MVKFGKRPDAAQSKLPPSTITPPIVVPWPPMNLVVECRTMFAPHSNGRHRYGVAKVLSITSGMRFSCAIAATSSNGNTLIRGLPSVSPYRIFVLGRIARRKFSGSAGSTKVTSIPSRGKV